MVLEGFKPPRLLDQNPLRPFNLYLFLNKFKFILLFNYING